MILVTAGTHAQPFDRLVDVACALAEAHPEEEVVLQRGTSNRAAPGCTAHRFLPPSALHALAQGARMYVCHGGLASIFVGWDCGHRPVVVPRRPDLGEHVDGHQLAFARHLGERICCVSSIAEALAAVEAGPRTGAPPPDHSAAFCRRLDALALELAGLRSRRTGHNPG